MGKMMRGLLLIVLLLAGPTILSAQDAEPRLQRTINEGWRYAPGPLEGAQAPGYADSTWTVVDVPHTWNAEDAFDDVAGYRRGIGWYRKRLQLPSALRGKRLFLYFEGANQVADVYVNGQHAGGHVGGYTAFAVDITELARFDRPTMIAVRVNNRHDPDIPPLDADFTFYGGIYRDVWLMATAPVHLSVTHHASPGVYIDTPEVSDTAATVRIRSRVVNHTMQPKPVTVVQRIVDARGQPVTERRTRATVAPDTVAQIEQTSDSIENPRLWSPNDPYLYRVYTEVRDTSGALFDRIDNPLGFRWFSASGEGFRLNGEPLPLKGTNRHQDYPGYGNALPDRFHRRDLRIINGMGFNFLRLAHYPQDPTVLDAADRRGLLLWEEIPVVNLITLSEAFTDNALRRLTEMIHQHYNHPSVAMWGYMNEIMLVRPDPVPERYYEAILDLAQQLEARAQELDPHRLTATAQSFGEIYNGKGVSDVTDVLGMNLYFGWYYEELESFGAFLDSLRQAHPDRPFLISEYGAGSDERVHTETPRAFDFSTEYQQRVHEQTFRQIEARPYLVGSAVWNQFDFGSEHRQDTKNAINQKGIYFYNREPKDIAAYYRARLSEAPVLHIATRSWARRAGSRPEGRAQPATIYTNLDSVALAHNGVSLGVKAVENSTARWSVPFQSGDNQLVAHGTGPQSTARDAVVVHYTDRGPIFETPNPGVRTIAVNAGAHYQFIDEAGLVWEADRAYQRKSWGYVEGSVQRTHHHIRHTPDDPLFQAARNGATAYRFDVPDGRYMIELRFAEQQYETAGKRIFDVYVNGKVVLTSLDLAKRYGRYRAVRFKTPVLAADEEGLLLRFESQVGQPTINSIRVRQLRW